MSHKKPLSFGLLAKNLCRAFRDSAIRVSNRIEPNTGNIDRDSRYGANFARAVLNYGLSTEAVVLSDFARSRAKTDAPGELHVAELDAGDNEPLLPGWRSRDCPGGHTTSPRTDGK